MPMYDNLPSIEYEFDLLDSNRQKEMLMQRKGNLEAALYNNLLEQKMESISSNPHKNKAIAEKQKEAREIQGFIELLNFELSMLDVADAAEAEGHEDPVPVVPGEEDHE